MSTSSKRKSSNLETKIKKKKTRKSKNNTTDVPSAQSNDYEELWERVNNHFQLTPKYQNLHVKGVNDDQLRKAEQRLGKIKLPDDIKQAVRIHNGREKFGYGLHYRSPTTDLFPIDQWRPYEKEDWCHELFECLVDDKCIDGPMKEDLREHLKVYDNENSEKSVGSKKFQGLKTEMLVIGEGMDDYVEQYLLGLRTGTLYLQILNIPEWKQVGTFEDWVNMALEVEHDEDDENDDD